MSAKGTPITIKPVAFRTEGGRPARSRPGPGSIFGILLFLVVILALSGAAWFLFTATRVALDVHPEPESMQIGGGFPIIHVGEVYLLRNGTYSLSASLTGYQDLDQAFEVTDDSHAFAFTMKTLPGLLSVEVTALDTQEALERAACFLNGEPAGNAPLEQVELSEGEHQLEIRAEGYLPFTTNLVMEGMGKATSIACELTPAWAEVYLNAKPAETTVSVNGEEKGGVPVSLKLMSGPAELLFEAPGYKSLTTQLVVVANTPIRLETIQLELADGLLSLTSDPPGALITIDGDYRGKTPANVPVRPNTNHLVVLTKPGYQQATREASLGPLETNILSVALEAVNASIKLKVTPGGTMLVVDGKEWGATPEVLELSAAPHIIEISKPGYEPFRTTVTPRVDFQQELSVALTELTPEPAQEEPPASTTTGTGYAFVRIEPGSFGMGSSRREQGRRSNETLREVELTRPFYLGAREVSNAEFRAFKEGHNSGSIKNSSLNLDQQAAANLSWEEAAAYCNWLSRKEGLPEVYEQRGGSLKPKEPLPHGYRLPTEAEWAYCARKGSPGDNPKYAWGQGFPPSNVTGNYADKSVSTILANVLADYNDGHAVSAPPASFPADALGLYDMGGNVSEWCHDVYQIYPYEPGKVEVDPTGPAEGRFHVIRGGSWKQSSITALRLSYRDYGDEGKNDVGFRVCRYAEQPGGTTE